jgi:predicted RNase H-like HicB family nuclease
MRQVLVYRGEDGFWVAECPSLSGWVSQGEARNPLEGPPDAGRQFAD